jgi:Bacterial PH domain
MNASTSKRYALPEPLPAGESVLWQGQPKWRGLALRAFHVRGVAIYFGLLALWRLASGLAEGDTAISAAVAVLWLLLPGAGACGVLLLLAWLTARTTRYTITSRRVVMQFGVALPMTLNIPFRIIGSAAVNSRADGSSDIPIAITGNDRLAFLLLWPHARPWRAARAEPMLREVEDGRRVADILSRAIAASLADNDFRSPADGKAADAAAALLPEPSAAAA